MKETYKIPQNKLTGECWMVQFIGIKACENCEFLNTPECGGKYIRERLINKKGHHIPIGKRVE